jgi:hypothetical protein
MDQMGQGNRGGQQGVGNQQNGGALAGPLMPNFPPRVDVLVQPELTLLEQHDQFR